MINLSTERSSAVKTSKESLLSKRARGKVRLPPLSNKQLAQYIPQPEQIMQSEHRRSASFLSPHITEGLLTSVDSKCPRSPSNLSLHFNFEESAPENGLFVESIDPVQVVNKNGQKRVKRSVSKTPRVNKAKPKGYHLLDNEEPIVVEEKQAGYSKNRSNTITRVSTIKPKPTSHSDRTGTTPHPRTPGAKPHTETLLRFTADNRERKRSTYNLREFLSLPADSKQKISSVSGLQSNNKRINLHHDEKNDIRLSPHTKTKPSDECTYDVFEFLKLSAESSRQFSAGGKKKLKEIRPKIGPTGKSMKPDKKPEIPSVIVADWSLNTDSSNKRTLIRPTRELPKANFPSEDFPKTPQKYDTLQAEEIHRQRGSVYDLKEFLTLPDAARLHSERQNKHQNTKPRSNSFEKDPSRETDVKYDLAEFLNFLETGGSGSPANSPSHDRRRDDLTDLGLRNRSLSVYDVYEFLQATSTKELSKEGIRNTTSQGKPSIIDMTTLVANSSPATHPLPDMLSPISNEEKASQASCYDLREFLSQPMTMEDNQNESQTNRSSAGRLRIN